MLSNREKKYLRSKTNKMKANFQIGKEGITENQLEAVLDYLEKHELMKITVLQNCLYDINDLADIFDQNDIEIVQVIGRVIVLYKESVNYKTIDLSHA